MYRDKLIEDLEVLVALTVRVRKVTALLAKLKVCTNLNQAFPLTNSYGLGLYECKMVAKRHLARKAAAATTTLSSIGVVKGETGSF